MRIGVGFVIFLASFSKISCAADLSLEYPALERILGQQLFTQDGRKYVRGSQTAKCNYAYLETPHIGAENGQLRIQAHFSGRTAADLFGHCLGLGDAFDVTIHAIPYYHDGLLGLRDVRVDSAGRDGFYARRVRDSMAQTLSRDFQYKLRDDVKRLLEERRAGAPFGQQLRAFNVPQVRVTPRALILTLDFELLVQ